jgi:ABC-type branched-subunit amino acid transport system substrate-binding protein
LRKHVGVVVLLVVVSIVASACGSRRSGPPPGIETASKAPSTKSGSGNGGDAGSSAPASAQVGTLEASCGKANPASGATDRGVTDTSITIGVISDKSGVVAVPTAGIDGSAQAFVDFCNSLGGINGRELILNHYDSKILNEGDAMREACEDDNFALVGSGSVQDDQGAVTMVECDLVEVAAYTATYVKGLSPRVFQPLPNPGTAYAVGPGNFIAERFPKAAKKAAIMWPNLPVGRIQAERQQDAYKKAGFKFVYSNPTDVLVQNWGPVVAALQDKGAEWVTDITTLSEMQHLLQAMSDAGLKPQVVDLGQQYYDQSFPGSPGTDGALVLTNTAPFEEADDNPALGRPAVRAGRQRARLEPDS